MLEIQLPPGTSGDTVAIGFYGFNNEGNGYLSLAEFEVLGGAATTMHRFRTPH